MLVARGARGDLVDTKGMNVLASAAAFGQVGSPTLNPNPDPHPHPHPNPNPNPILTPTPTPNQVGVINAVGEKLGVGENMPQTALEQADVEGH